MDDLHLNLSDLETEPGHRLIHYKAWLFNFNFFQIMGRKSHHVHAVFPLHPISLCRTATNAPMGVQHFKFDEMSVTQATAILATSIF